MPLNEVRALGRSTQLENGQRASALRFADERVMAILAALAGQVFAIEELSNKTLRPRVVQRLNRAYTSSQMSYDLRRLRLKGLLVRIPRSHRYRLTELGSKIVVFFTKLYERMFRPGLAACVSEHPLPYILAEALETVATEIDALVNCAMVTPAAI